jgi:hypothetical protein
VTAAPATSTPPVDLTARTDTRESDVPARAVGAVALAALALIHVEDLPDTFIASRLVGAEYLALIAVSIGIAAALLTRHAGPRLWFSAGAVAGSAMFAYVLSRTVGIPGDYGDIGNWRCTLGLAALTVEAMIIMLSGWSFVNSLPPVRLRRRSGQ